MKKTIIITAVGSFSAPAAVKSCREAGYRVVGTDINPREVIAESMSVDRFVRMPRADAGEAYLAAMEKLIEEEDAMGLIPLTDVEIDALNPVRERFLPTELWLSPQESLFRARDKEKSRGAADLAFRRDPELAERFRTIPTARFSAWLSAQYGGISAAGLPMVMKPRDGRSSEGLYRVRTAEDLQTAVREIRLWGGEDRYLVQPLIEGNVITVDVVRSADGACIAVPREELRRTHNGAGIAVRVFRDPLVEKAACAVAEELGILGCVNFELIAAEDGTYRFLECNPRFSGGIAFSIAAGQDVIRDHISVFTEKASVGENRARPCSIARKYVEVITE